MFSFFTIFGVKIPVYGFCMFLAVSLVIALTYRIAKKKNISFDSILVVVGLTIGMALIGGKSLYILVTYSFEDVVAYIRRFDFSFFDNSGIVFYGGLIFGILGAFLAARITRINPIDIEEIFVPFVPLGHAVGRVGCFFSGCCYGLPYKGFLAVELENGQSYFPIQLVEAGANILIMLYLLHSVKKTRIKHEIIIKYLLAYSITRFVLEFFRGDAIRGVYFCLSTSQWISIFIFIICIAAILLSLYNKKEKRH